MATDAISTIFKIVKTINKIVEEVQCNKKRCKRLRDRINTVVPIVNFLDLETNVGKSTYTKALVQLKDCLVSSEEFIQTFKEKGFKKSVEKVIWRKEIKDHFDELNRQLTDVVPVLTLGIQVEAGSSLALLRDKAKELEEEDEEDEKIDWKEIEEIIKGLPDQIDEVGEKVVQKVDQTGAIVGDKVDGVKEAVDELKEMVGQLRMSPSQSGMLPTVDLKTITMGDLTSLTEIAKGRFGKVYKGKYQQCYVAVKQMDGPDYNNPYDEDEVASNLIEEATQMKQVETENVVRVWGICPNPGSLLLVMEYMEKGPLRDVLREQDVELPWKLRVRMAMEGARGLCAIHNAKPKPLLHRNITSKTFLVDEDFHVKISGFGFTKTLTSARRAGPKYSNEYLAPEQLSNINSYGCKNEIFAFGIVMWEIATRKVPYEGLDRKALLKSKKKETIPEGTGCPDGFREIIDCCRNDDPLLRPHATDIIDKLESVRL